jgi:hypothetical protein
VVLEAGELEGSGGPELIPEHCVILCLLHLM